MQIVKTLLAKCWKKENADLATGTHWIDETITVRVCGTVEKLDDEFATPTVSIPLIPTLAYFADRLGLEKAEAISTQREALHEAMTKKVKEDGHIQDRIGDFADAVKAIRQELIADLPKMRREGKLLVDGLTVEMEPSWAAELV